MNSKEISILDSALKLFVSQGFHGTSTAEIAKNANVSNGTLFHYFNSKDSLIQSLHDTIKKEQIASISNDLDVNGDPKEQIASIWRNALNWAYNNKNKYKFLSIYKYSPYKKKHKSDVGKFIKEFDLLVEKGIQKKQLRFMPGDYVYEITNANVYGMVNYLESNPVKYRTPEFMRQSFEWFWQGMKP